MFAWCSLLILIWIYRIKGIYLLEPKHTPLKPLRPVLTHKMPGSLNCVTVILPSYSSSLFWKSNTWLLESKDLLMNMNCLLFLFQLHFCEESLWRETVSEVYKPVTAYKLLSCLFEKIISSNIKSYPPQLGSLL